MSRDIKITLSDGNEKFFKKGITGFEIACEISKSLAKSALACTLNDQLTDLSWPIFNDSKLHIHTIKDKEIAVGLIRHDCAHIMARAVQELWPDVKVTIGPVIDNGWYYDFDRKDPFSPDDLPIIEKKMREIINLREKIKMGFVKFFYSKAL